MAAGRGSCQVAEGLRVGPDGSPCLLTSCTVFLPTGPPEYGTRCIRVTKETDRSRHRKKHSCHFFRPRLSSGRTRPPLGAAVAARGLLGSCGEGRAANVRGPERRPWARPRAARSEKTKITAPARARLGGGGRSRGTALPAPPGAQPGSPRAPARPPLSRGPMARLLD